MDVYKTPYSSTFGKRGQILHAQAREVVANVIKFMEMEAESLKTKGHPLIPFDKYKQRARMATGINERLYETIRKEAKHVKAGEAPGFSTPQRSRKCYGAEIEIHNYSHFEIADVMFDCSQCSHQFASIFQLNHHVQMKHVRAVTSFDAVAEPEQFPCTFCDYKSHYQFELYEHFKHHNLKIEKMANIPFWHEFKRYACERCGYESNSSLALVKHRVSCEKENSTEEAVRRMESPGTEAKAKPVKCNHCSYRANQKGRLNRHKLRDHVAPDDWLSCGHCSYRTVESRDLKRHNRLRHSSQNRIVWLQCKHCSYRAKHKSVLEDHILSQHAPRKEIG